MWICCVEVVKVDLVGDGGFVEGVIIEELSVGLLNCERCIAIVFEGELLGDKGLEFWFC